MLTPSVLFVSSFITYSQIHDSNNVDFHQKFGSLFYEFKNDKGFLSTQYYTIYFIRRLAYILSQVYLNGSPFTQAGLNIGFTVILIAQLALYLPFKETSLNISVLAGEIATLFTFAATTSYLTNLSPRTSQMLEKVIVFTILGAMAIQFLISVYTMLQAFRLLWRKIIKYKAQAILKAQDSHSTLA